MKMKIYDKVKGLKLRRVKWLDATDRTLSQEELEGSDMKKLLTERVTVGLIYKDNKDGVVVIRDICEDGQTEVSVIPKSMLVSIDE